MATTTYLVITDGTTTCTFADGAATPGATNYEVAYGGWSPTVAGLRRSQLGGRGPYDDVVETMQINVTGSSAANALANLQTLVRIIDQAERFGRGESEAPVTINYSPGGATVSSTGTPLKAVILGYAPGETRGVILPSNFEGPLLINRRYVVSATLKFLRRGLWLHTESNWASSATANGDVASITIGSALTVRAPMSVYMSNAYLSSSLKPGFFIVAHATGAIQVTNAEGMTATGWTSVADGGVFARNTNVLRYTPTGTSESASGLATITQLFKFHVFANIRNNSSTPSYQIRVAGFYDSISTTVPLAYTPRIVIPTTGTTPQWYYVGIIVSPLPVTRVAVYATASATGSSLDIDSLVCVDDLYSQIVTIQGGHAITATAQNIQFVHQSLSDYRPEQTNTSLFVAYAGDIFFSYKPETLSTTIACAWLATGDAGGATTWRQTSGGAVVNNTWTIYRYTGYLTPE